MALKDDYLTISEGAEKLGVTRQTVSRWIHQGKLTAERIGRETLIEKEPFLKFLFGRVVEMLGTVINMTVEVYIRMEYEYGSSDKIELTNIDEDGIFQFSVTEEDGNQEKVYIQTSIEMSGVRKHHFAAFKIDRIWREDNEGEKNKKNK